MASDGSVFVLDYFKQRVQHFSPAGELIAAWGEYGNGPGQFPFSPSHIAVATNGEVLISGSEGIQRFTADGTYLGLINWTPFTNPNAPGPMTVDAAGNIWVYDYGGQKVVKLDPSGTILTSFGSAGFDATTGALSVPADIAVSPDGLAVYVLDAGPNLIKKFTSGDGTSFSFTGASQPTTGAGSADGRLSDPNAIALDPKTGELVVADAGNNRLERFNASDLGFAGKSGVFGFADDQYIYPAGVEFDRWGNLWVSDQGNDRIKRFGDAPVVTVTAPATSKEGSIALVFESSDPAAECDRANGDSIPLAVGANTIKVTCTNAEGAGSGTASVTRTVDVPPPVITIDPSLKLEKKIKLSKKRKLTFSATCPDGCTVSGKLKIGKKSAKLKSVGLGAKSGAQSVSFTLSKSTYKKVFVALKKKQPVSLIVTVLSYKATQGKTGKAKISR